MPVGPLKVYTTPLKFAAEPVLRILFAAVIIGVVMVALGMDPIAIVIGWIEEFLRGLIGF